jgi:hypothetical protein
MARSTCERSILFCVIIFLVITGLCVFESASISHLNGQAFAQASKKDSFEPNVFNRTGRPIGGVDADGNVYNLQGRPIGSVDSGGTVYSVFQKPLGKVDSTGKVFNLIGTLLGSVDAYGNVFNINGRKLGSVKPPDPENIIQIGGAAWLLLLRRR